MTTKEILHKLGIEALNAMQQDTLQTYRKSANLVLLSPTGSGKTLAYLLPLLESLNPNVPEVQAIVLVPTRELALQTGQVVKQSGTHVKAVSVYGGRPTMDEHRTLLGVGPQLVIGTPGRLLDHLNKGNIDSQAIHTLIIDEFDKCLELGFREEVSQVFTLLPHIQKRMLLSATDNPEITSFLPEYSRLDYLEVEDEPEGRIETFIVKSAVKDKLESLKRLLLSVGSETSIVFVGFRESVERIAHYLKEQGFYISALHGGLEQKERERALYRFVSGSVNILISTDLASRGLDIPELNNVIHYHLPPNHECYIHRNGRTARWDKQGRVFLIVGPEEDYKTLTKGKDLPEFCNFRTDCPQQPLWESLYIGKGKKDKLSRGDILGYLIKMGGLEKEDVGRIDVCDHYSYVAVLRKKVNETLVRLRGTKIKGMKTIIERIR